MAALDESCLFRHKKFPKTATKNSPANTHLMPPAIMPMPMRTDADRTNGDACCIA